MILNRPPASAREVSGSFWLPHSTDNRSKARKLFQGLLETFRPADPRVVSVERA